MGGGEGNEGAGGYSTVVDTERIGLQQHSSQYQYNGADKKMKAMPKLNQTSNINESSEVALICL